MKWPQEALAPTDVTRARKAPAFTTAPFWILESSAIPGLREAAMPTKTWLGRQKDGFTEYLKQHGREGIKYTGSARALSALLSFLHKRGIELQPPEHRDLADYVGTARGCTAFVLTAAQGRPHLEILNPFLFFEAELLAHYNESSEPPGLQNGKPMLDGVVALRDCLRGLASDSVALLLIS